MSDWVKEKLGKLCSISIGGTPSRSNPSFWDYEKVTNNLWVSIKDLDKSVICETLEYITDAGVQKSNVKLVKKGTVLMSFKLTIGKVAIVGKELYTNEAIAAFESHKIDSLFLYYGFQQWDLLKDVDQAIKGATLNKSKLSNIEIYLPLCKTEQYKIAEVLSKIDKAIAQTETLIAKYKRIKTGLMQDLLTRGIDENGQLRDPKTHKFKRSPLGMIPDEWDIFRLEDVTLKITSGSRFWASYYSDEGAKFIRIGNLTREHINLRLDNVQYVTPPLSSEAKRTLLKTGDLLISVTADLGIIGVVPQNFGEAYINQHIALLTLDQDRVNPWWLGNFLAGHTAQQAIAQVNESGAKAGLNLPTVASLSIAVPRKLEEQNRVAKILKTIDDKFVTLYQNCEKLNFIKTGLMQDLLTGKTSVKPLLKNQP